MMVAEADGGEDASESEVGEESGSEDVLEGPGGEATYIV